MLSSILFGKDILQSIKLYLRKIRCQHSICPSIDCKQTHASASPICSYIVTCAKHVRIFKLELHCMLPVNTSFVNLNSGPANITRKIHLLCILIKFHEQVTLMYYVIQCESPSHPNVGLITGPLVRFVPVILSLVPKPSML